MTATISEKIVSALTEIFPHLPVSLHEPVFGGNEKEYVNECISSTFVSSVGKYVDKFEEMLAEYTGVKRAIAVVNGTAALHISLLFAGVRQNDEVIMPTLTFVAVANAVSYCGAVPHFVDSSPETLGICPEKLTDYLKEIAEVKSDGYTYNKKTGRRIKACVAMHTFGHPVDMDMVNQICSEYRISVVEDAAEAIGSFYKNKHVGNFGKVAVLSFNGNKIITTGGGGAILTNDEKLGQKAKHLTTTAKVPHLWEIRHDAIAYNYRMPNINAALGCAQMEQLPLLLRKKRGIAEKYERIFRKMEGVSIFTEPVFAKSNYWLNVLLLDEGDIAARNAVIEQANEMGIIIRPAWVLMHKLKMFDKFPRMDLAFAENIEKRLINLPSSSNVRLNENSKT